MRLRFWWDWWEDCCSCNIFCGFFCVTVSLKTLERAYYCTLLSWTGDWFRPFPCPCRQQSQELREPYVPMCGSARGNWSPRDTSAHLQLERCFGDIPSHLPYQLPIPLRIPWKEVWNDNILLWYFIDLETHKFGSLKVWFLARLWLLLKLHPFQVHLSGPKTLSKSPGLEICNSKWIRQTCFTYIPNNYMFYFQVNLNLTNRTILWGDFIFIDIRGKDFTYFRILLVWNCWALINYYIFLVVKKKSSSYSTRAMACFQNCKAIMASLGKKKRKKHHKM